MKKVILLLLGVVLLQGSFSHAADSDYDDDGFADPVQSVLDQVSMLKTQSPKQCTSEYQKLFAGNTIRIALFNGYQNFDDITRDGVHARAMVRVLQMKCSGNLEVCGFTVIGKRKNATHLEKTINGKKILLSVYSTSVTDNNAANMSYDKLIEEQNRYSMLIKKQFYKDLVNADIVFYSGHSRIGAGLGFDSESAIEEGVNAIFRRPLVPILKALAQRPSRLKYFGIFACESEQYYRSDIERVNPGVSLILTKAEVDDAELEEMSIGALNSILTQKCESDFRKSVIPVILPKDRFVDYIRR